MPHTANQCFQSFLLLTVASLLFDLSACGGNSKQNSLNGFGMVSSSQTGEIANNENPIISRLDLSSATVIAGNSVSATITLSRPAPPAGMTLQLASSDSSTVQVPRTLYIAGGLSTAVFDLPTSSVAAASSVSITARYANSKAGATLNVVPTTSAPFSVSVQPSVVTVQQAKTGTSKITTKVSNGYNHSLQLKISGDPVGVSTSASPATIHAPGAGTSKLTVDVGSVTETSNYPLTITASDGKNSTDAKLTLKVISGTTNPDATFKGCLYKTNGHRYQAIDLSVGKAGTYPYNAVLYYGTTCDPNNFADQVGFGDPLTIGGGYIIWFTDFKDQTDMSAIWYLGDENSKCVNYSTAPPC